MLAALALNEAGQLEQHKQLTLGIRPSHTHSRTHAVVDGFRAEWIEQNGQWHWRCA